MESYLRRRINLEGSDSYDGGYHRGSYGEHRENRGFGGPRPFRPSPVRVGEEFDVKVESLSRRGDSGVARVQGLVVFVPNTKPGDSVRIRIIKVGRGYASGETLNDGTTQQNLEEEAKESQPESQSEP